MQVSTNYFCQVFTPVYKGSCLSGLIQLNVQFTLLPIIIYCQCNFFKPMPKIRRENCNYSKCGWSSTLLLLLVVVVLLLPV